MLTFVLSLFWVLSNGQACPSQFECALETCQRVSVGPIGGGQCLFGCPDGINYLPNNYINAGEKLVKGQAILSSNKRYTAVMQGDNNFCINKFTPNGHHEKVLWCAMTNGGGTRFMIYQLDNNICVYEEGVGPSKWCTSSHNPNETPGALIMQNDGNLCAYEGNDPTTPSVIWCSNTAQGLIPIINTPDPFGTVEISVILLVIIGVAVLINIACLVFYAIKKRKKKYSYGKVSMDSDY